MSGALQGDRRLYEKCCKRNWDGGDIYGDRLCVCKVFISTFYICHIKLGGIMKQIFEQYGDLLITFVAASAMAAFLFTMIKSGGLLYDWMQTYSKLICVMTRGIIV